MVQDVANHLVALGKFWNSVLAIGIYVPLVLWLWMSEHAEQRRAVGLIQGDFSDDGDGTCSQGLRVVVTCALAAATVFVGLGHAYLLFTAWRGGTAAVLPKTVVFHAVLALLIPWVAWRLSRA